MAIDKDHYISIKNGEFDATTPSDLDHLFKVLAVHPKADRLVLHFHGGLVPQSSAVAIAETTLLDHYRSAGAYPVFFFWQTGLRDLVTGNLAEVLRERIFERLLLRVAQFVLAKLRQREAERGARLELPDEFELQEELARSTSDQEPFQEVETRQLPPETALNRVEQAQFRDLLERDFILQTEATAIASGMRSPEEIAADTATRGGGVKASTHTLMSPSVIEEIRAQAPTPQERGIVATGRIVKGAAAILARVIDRMADRRDHGLYPTIVEELLHEFYLGSVGGIGWRLMKKDSADAFQPDPYRYAGTAFLESLRGHWDAGHRPRIVLVGHSAGSVFISNFLRFAESALPPAVQFDVVLLAPACTFEHFADTLSLAQSRIAGIRLFALQDALEVREHMVPGYPRSILYFVSGVLEDERDKPLLGMQRFYSADSPFDSVAYPEVARVRRFLSSLPGRTVWAIEDSGAGRASSATGHSDFDDVDIPTLQSVRHIISQGF